MTLYTCKLYVCDYLITVKKKNRTETNPKILMKYNKNKSIGKIFSNGIQYIFLIANLLPCVPSPFLRIKSV